MLRIMLRSITFGGFLLLLASFSPIAMLDSSSDYAATAPLSYKSLSYNRYQAIYFCKQNRWAFCQSWGELSVTRLA
ncbi:hypothetical protein L1D40_15360 [Shewanella insulae]|uniref:hypothetical protein n=1 Tax=Shewanella insulae TaxID=2681496 RepID=UPI001EFE6F78|nr:hypothetical protein [Shewanella insulae]MCG9756580.1 hypothetical protein [Shewanella insulae]